ncbi:acyl-CoA dehydrogenase [Nonomuraea sp. NPDC050202]|uniref:acyl-CoA dehydrogenase family protein n=1 Tax=Nonomuraea sp. NPDC050202 TaxID=3155035 RepID=UPI0033FC5BE2
MPYLCPGLLSSAERPDRPAALLANDLERLLGDPDDPSSPFSYARCLELDRREAFPSEMCDELDRMGVQRFYVPRAYGGALVSFEQLSALVRVLARRDLTLAIGHAKTFLGAAPLWVAGDPGPAARLAEAILAGARVSLGLTEREHGGDLAATETRAVRDRGGYRISGEKWLINNATRGRMITLLAGTDQALSLFLLDKRALEPEEYRCLPKIRTHGIRGADISGIELSGARVPQDALIGTPGAGLPILVKALQLTRTGCLALSLGALDQAIELATRFARERILYGRPLAELPAVRLRLGQAYATLFVAEAVNITATRCVHVLPDELSVVSAVAKAVVPSLAEDCLDSLGELLGIRSFLAEGRLQKVERDHRIVGIFDGSTFVNRSVLINQFGRLARSFHRGRADQQRLRQLFRIGGKLPPFDAARLGVVSRNGCGVVQSIPQAVEAVTALAAEGRAPDALAVLARALLIEVQQVHEQLAARNWPQLDRPPEAFHLAQRYELCFAAAACLHLWVHNRTRVASGLWDEAAWLTACLGFLLARLRPDSVTATRHADEAMIALYERVERARPSGPLSIVPIHGEAPARGRG